MSPRAPALPLAERRTAIVDVARDLIARRGSVPSTKEIALAANLAEGTIFRAFPTKDALVDAVAASTFCPATFRRGLQYVDPRLPLRERLVALVTLLQQRFLDVFGVMAALGLSAPPVFPPGAHDRCRPETGHVGVEPSARESSGRRPTPAEHAEAQERRAYEMLRFLEPDADKLRVEPSRLLHYVRLLTFSGSHRELADGSLLSPEEIVDLLLVGVVTDEARAEVRPAADPREAPTDPRADAPADPPAHPPADPPVPLTRKAR